MVLNEDSIGYDALGVPPTMNLSFPGPQGRYYTYMNYNLGLYYSVGLTLFLKCMRIKKNKKRKQ